MNRRIVLASRPRGEPADYNFRLETDLQIPKPAEGQILVRNKYLSIDPYMRFRMNDRESYARPVALGDVMVGGTVGRIVESKAQGYAVGEVVFGYGGWQDYAIFDSNDREVMKVTGSLPMSTALGVCGMPGMTGYFGLLKLGQPKQGETVVVSAASGAVGSVVGQIARIYGCHVVGIAGGPAKCQAVVEGFGFDACIDHRAPDMEAKLVAACPRGIDVYFENVGGEVLDVVAKLLNLGSRVPICGYVSQYNEESPVTPDVVLAALTNPPEHRLFVVWEWAREYASAAEKLREWVLAGEIRYREDVSDGLESAPRALIGLLRGENFGKRVVKLE